MDNLTVGILCLTYSFFIYFHSPKEWKNMLGYKSPQKGMHKIFGSGQISVLVF